MSKKESAGYMAISIGKYDVGEVNVSVGGVMLSGYAEKTFVKVSKSEDNSKFKYSAKGDAASATSYNTEGEIEVTLMQTSPYVSYLNSLATKGTHVPAWVISNNEIKEQYGGTTAVVMKPADAEFSDDISDRKFKIKVLDYVAK